MIRSKNWNENENSMFSKSMTRSQKSLLSSACSNTSLICDVFNSKQSSKPPKQNINFHNIRSSNQNTRETDKDRPSNSYKETQSFMRSSIDENITQGRENTARDVIRKSFLEEEDTEKDILEKEIIQHGADYERGIHMDSYSRRQSSVIYDSSTPLLASRRRRSSVGIISANSHTRSGRASDRIKSSGKTKTRPTFVANTLANIVSPKLSNSNERGVRVTSGKATKNKKIRCYDCRKRLNITNMFICRCEKKFCAKHRHAESHSCTYDYKSDGKKYLEKANPFIPIPKLPKI